MESMKSEQTLHYPIIKAVPPRAWYGARHTQAIMMFFLILLSFAMRTNLSIAIVAMTSPNTSANPDVPTYHWDDQSIILSSYFIGYVIPQILAGLLAKHYGPKWFLVGTSAIGSIFTVVIPFIAQFGSWAVILCRVGQGLCHGFYFPSCHSMLAKWVPKSEKSRINTFVYAAGTLGIALSMSFTGWISGTSLGWPYSFYGHGIAGFLWTVVWMLMGKNSPADHGGIDPEELKYIQDSAGNNEYNKVPTPWKAIATSLPVWAILISSWGQLWGFSTLVTNIPSYLANILGYDIKANGLLSAGPYLLFWILSFVFSALSDHVISGNILSTEAARKIANSCGLYIPGVLLLTLGVISRAESANASVALIIFFVTVGVSSAFLSGYNVNHIDLSPVHAATIMGITNGFGSLSSIVAPLIVEFIVTDQSNSTQWATLFYIASAMYFIGNTIYLIFASGDLQVWNHIKTYNSDEDIEKEPQKF